MMIFLLIFIVNVLGKQVVQEPLLPFESPFEESSLFIDTNQGRFAVNNANVTMESVITPKIKLASGLSANTTMVEMLGIIHNETATLKKAWARWTFPHVSLVMQFTDGRCQEMEWYPLMPLGVPGEHPVGQATMQYVRNARCRNAPSLFHLPDPTINVLNWFQDAIKLKSTQEVVDLLRWTPGHLQLVNKHVTRRQVYSAFFEEASRFKDEEKYSCSSFINNVFGIATGHRYVDPGTMVHLLKLGAQRFGGLSVNPYSSPLKVNYLSCKSDSECRSDYCHPTYHSCHTSPDCWWMCH